jgi:prepilin-type N-terminal cleavage/methylation domain-containing protein
MLKQTQRGFTVIELLAVIGIISLLMAITFPVVGVVKRKNLETQCMTNMSQLYTAMKAFQQDQHCCPEFIAGPVQWQVDGSGNILYGSDNKPLVRPLNRCTGTLDNVASFDTNGNPKLLYPNYGTAPIGQVVSLYPEYIKGTNGLNCPNNAATVSWLPAVSMATNDDPQNNQYYIVVEDPMYTVLGDLNTAATSNTNLKTLSSLRVGTDPDDITKTYPFYLYSYSSYDFQVLSQTSLSGEAHYSSVWTNNPGDTTNENDYTAQQYLRQLHWKTPPDDAMITWCSSHLIGTGGDYIVLFLDGRAQRFPAGTLNTLVQQAGKDYSGEPDWMSMWQVEPKK